MKTKFWDRDSIQFGILVGLLGPVIFYLVLDVIDWAVMRICINNGVKLLRDNILPDDIQYILAAGGANFFFFYRFVNRRGKDKTGRGILMMTFVYTFLYILLFYMLEIGRIKIFTA
jgi:hypothetical protein